LIRYGTISFSKTRLHGVMHTVATKLPTLELNMKTRTSGEISKLRNLMTNNFGTKKAGSLISTYQQITNVGVTHEQNEDIN